MTAVLCRLSWQLTPYRPSDLMEHSVRRNAIWQILHRGFAAAAAAAEWWSHWSTSRASNATFSVRNRPFSRPLATCVPSSLLVYAFAFTSVSPTSAPCLILLSASGLLRFILLPLPVISGSFCFHFAKLHYSPVSHLSSFYLFLPFLGLILVL